MCLKSLACLPILKGPEAEGDPDGQDTQEPQGRSAEEEKQREEEGGEEEQPAAVASAVPQSYMFSPQGVVLDPAVLALAQPMLHRAKGKAGGAKKAVIYSQVSLPYSIHHI